MPKITAKNKNTGEVRDVIEEINKSYIIPVGKSSYVLDGKQFHSEWEVIDSPVKICQNPQCSKKMKENERNGSSFCSESCIFQKTELDKAMNEPTPMNNIDKIIVMVYNRSMNKQEYASIHYWLRTKYGKVKKCENKKCPKKSKIYDWALKTGEKHTRDITKYKQLCRSCHIKYDWNSQKTLRFVSIAHTPLAEKNRKLSLTGRKRKSSEKIAIKNGWNKNYKRFNFKGKMLTLSEIADKTGIKYKTLYARVYIWKTPIERALSTKILRPYGRTK